MEKPGINYDQTRINVFCDFDLSWFPNESMNDREYPNHLGLREKPSLLFGAMLNTILWCCTKEVLLKMENHGRWL